ncbi:hypothetical protein BU15DRAFT_67389 [Melanogaster broomeanus]|nr:hypothetical protein BU15DRAFT_67389 [Melanogaster broomeanus]
MSATSPAAVARELLQAPLVGAFIAFVLYGITTIQTFFYFQTYPDDHVFLKLMVWSLWTLETIHSGLNVSFINHYLIDSFGDATALIKIPWDVLLIVKQACFQVGVLCLAHMAMFVAVPFNPIPDNPLKGMLTTVRFGTLFFNYMQVLRSLDYSPSHYCSDLSVVIITIMTIGIINDTLAATILALHLEEGRSGLFRTDRLINRLLAYTVATGHLQRKLSMFDCLALITDYDLLVQLLASKTTLIYLALVHILMKVYANSALMSLNLRRYQGRSLRGPVDIGLSDLGTPSFNTGQAGRDTCSSSTPHISKAHAYKTGSDY